MDSINTHNNMFLTLIKDFILTFTPALAITNVALETANLVIKLTGGLLGIAWILFRMYLANKEHKQKMKNHE